MVTLPRGSDLSRRLVVALGASLLGSGCAAPGPRPLVTQAAVAVPEPDPTLHGMVQGSKSVTETEQVVARMGRGPDGKPVVLKVLSPSLSAAQEEQIQRAFAIGDWKREVPLQQESDTWIETITRARK